MSEQVKRVIMTVAGVSIGGVAVGMFQFSDFGMDPFQVFAHGLWGLTRVGYGSFYMILNCIMLAVVLFVDRRKIGLGTVINVFLLGYIVEFSSWIFALWIPDPSLAVRAIFLLAGMVILCIASSLYFVANMGVSTYDAVALYMAEHRVAKFQYCRIGTDVVCVSVGFLLGATVGVGTLVTAFFMGPIIAFFNRHLSEPLRYGKRKRYVGMVKVQGANVQSSGLKF
jgi:uncharacterized membrane protein YczE